MDVDILVALIGLIGVIISVFVSARVTQNKVTQELQTQNAVQFQKIEELGKNVMQVKSELTQKIDSNQQMIDLKIEHLGNQQKEMQKLLDVHNDYARHMPVIEEQVKVINHRLEDLEAKKG